jgi:hypothetical protein
VLRRIAALLVAIWGTYLTVSLGSDAVGAATAVTAPQLTVLHFRGAFVPMQVTASAGRIWVVGSNDPSSFTECQLEEVTPSTMATRFFALPACPTDIAAIDGDVDMVAAAPGALGASGNTHEMHLEVFDPLTSQAHLMPPVVMDIPGSGIAHTNFVAGAGLLWLYGYHASGNQGSEQVVGIDPQTGSVTVTVADPPDIGGIFPALAVNGAGRWFGGGPGGPPGLVRAQATGPPTTLYSGPTRSSILWLSAVGATVWAGVDVYGSGERPSSVTHLVAVNAKGRVVVSTHPELVGDFPLVSAAGGRLWSMSYAGSCGGAEELIAVDPLTGASHAVESLPAPPEACNDEDSGSQLAALGSDVFVLIPSGSRGAGVLYRAET